MPMLLAALALSLFPQGSPTLVADLNPNPLDAPVDGQTRPRGQALGDLWVEAQVPNAGSRVFRVPSSGAPAELFPLPFPAFIAERTQFHEIVDLGNGRALLWVVPEVAQPPTVLATDGTPAGTIDLGLIPLLEFLHGETSDRPVAVQSGVAYFAANDVDGTSALFRSDGTAGGTFALYTPRSGEPLRNPTLTNDRLIYSRSDTVGSPAGLYSVGIDGSSPLELRAPGGPQVEFLPLRVLGGLVFAWNGFDGAGVELWRSDGTAAGTLRLSDIAPGSANSAAIPLASNGLFAYFSAFSLSTGRELWVTDGTAGGTRLVVDLAPGPAPGAASAAYGGAMLASTLVYGASTDGADFEPFRSAGTVASTQRLADLNPGPGPSFPVRFTRGLSSVLFNANTPGAGYEPYVYDGGAVRSLGDLEPGSVSSQAGDYVLFGGTTYFSAATSALGRELFEVDSSANTATLAEDLGASPISGNSNPKSFVRAAERGYFSAQPDGTTWALFSTDGTGGGTQQLVSSTFIQRPIATLDNGLVFQFDDGVSGRQPWFSDGTLAGTLSLGDLTSGGEPAFDSNTPAGVQLGQHVYFIARGGGEGLELWSTDGTAAGTQLSVSLEPGAPDGFGNTFWLERVDDQIYFDRIVSGSSALREVWVTDGTQAGTRLVAPTLLAGTQATGFRAFGDRLAFTTTPSDPALAYETFRLWTTDGTEAGTRVEAAGSGRAFWLRAMGDTLVFTRYDDNATLPAREVLALTPGGALVQLDAAPTPETQYFFGPQSLAGIYFSRGEATAPTSETWFTDGTVAGTQKVLDDGSIGIPIATGTQGVIQADVPGLGRELLISDGTAAGTELLFDTQPGYIGSRPGLLGRVGRRALFSAFTLEHGVELYAFDLIEAGGYVADPYGFGCGAPGRPDLRLEGEARLGETVTLQVEDLNPLTPTFVYASATPTALPLDGCSLYLGAPLVAIGAGVSGPLGEATFVYPLTTQPNWLGVTLAVQAAGLSVGGPALGLLELTNGLEIVFGG